MSEVSEMMASIKKKIPVCELMAGLAEEASELAQAALKLRRVWDQTNPTPKKEEEAVEDLFEEIGDVYLYVKMIGVPEYSIKEKAVTKLNRWSKRLEGKA